METIIMYGADWCPDCRRAKAFLEEHDVEFQYNNIELDDKSVRKVEEINKGKRIIPTFKILDKYVTNPDNAELAELLGINHFGRILFYGADWCPDCRRTKSFLDDNGIHYQFIGIDTFEWAAQKVEAINEGKRRIPTLIINGEALVNPDNATLQQRLQIEKCETHKVYDVAIIGAGAAGLTTAIYTQREQLATIILEKKNIGGNAFLTKSIENYPGFLNISGPDLMNKMAEQAKVYGTVIKEGLEVTSIVRKDGVFHLETNMGLFKGKTVVVAVGSTYRTLNIPGEEELIGSGVHFCATCDGSFYRGREVIVIGGGNSALEEGIFLSEFCKSVAIVSRSPKFKASQTYLDKLKERSNITSHMNKIGLEFLPDAKGNFEALKVRDKESGEEELINADGVFIFIGLVPNTAFLKETVELDERGCIVTQPGSVETNAPGIFAAGDCRKGAISQVAAATGEGVIASFCVKGYLRS